MRSSFFVLGVSSVVGLGLLLPAVLLAYGPLKHETARPYDEQVIDGDYRYRSEYLGELKGDPQMFEFSTGHEDKLEIKLLQKPGDDQVPFSLIVVRQNEERGVTEIGRLRSQEIVWEEFSDPTLGVTLISSNTFTADIKPGIYRIEVSTPENSGKYMMVVGSRDRELGYFATLSGVRAIQSFFDYSFFAIFASSLVFYPLGSIILLVLIYLTWRYRSRLIKHA